MFFGERPILLLLYNYTQLTKTQVYDHSGGEVRTVRFANAQILSVFETLKNGLQSAK